ncbi:Platelet-activating factor acetylhydrolase [Paraconiothyrium brasiliense]|uniref:1-alkyl-2-acetylglycerophosphocholine esterase n=1 Tax=Paraconiothyrium brasiliense TaxID=300254 RepID=A0ABR3S8T0_9PLEO
MRYAVGYGTAKVLDRERPSMISLFYPIERTAATSPTAVPYMPPLTCSILDLGLSRKGLPKVCNRMRLQASEYAGAISDDLGQFPLGMQDYYNVKYNYSQEAVLFSPGLTCSRHQYNAMAQSLASEGYAVVTMDHTEEAVVIEWPDGTHTLGNILPTVAQDDVVKHTQLLDTRVRDSRFVLTQLADVRVIKQLIPQFPHPRSPFDRPVDRQRAAIVGHSFGGATAVCAVMQDRRFMGAMNMDGSQYGSLQPVERLVVLFGRGEPDPRNRRNNPTWEHLSKYARYLREINLAESAHNTFSDLPLIFKLSGIVNEQFARELAGTLDGELSFKIVTAYIKDFADLVLKDKNGELYKESSILYPEMELMTERR